MAEKTYPRLMYRVPGPHRKPGKDGVSYAYVGVSNATEEDERAALGWHESVSHALGREEAHDAIDAADALSDVTQDVSEPAREVLEEEARALGIGFNWKTSDKALSERIAAKKG